MFIVLEHILHSIRRERLLPSQHKTCGHILNPSFRTLYLAFCLLCSMFQPDYIKKIKKGLYILVGTHKHIQHRFSAYKIYCKYIHCYMTNCPNINVYINAHLSSHNFCRLVIYLCLYWFSNSECLTSSNKSAIFSCKGLTWE